MSNLDNLVKKILDEGKEKADLIIEEANRVKEEIIDSKAKEAEENKKRIIEKATAEANMLKERTVNSAELQARNEKLKAKQAVIDRVFNIAKERLKNLDEDTFVSYLTDKIKTLQLTGEEIIVVPEKMKDKVKSLGLSLNVSEDETVDSGFLIKNKGIILNYTFDSLIDHYKEDLETEIAISLFKE